MHPLLIPYSGAALMLLLMATGRTVMERRAAWLFAWLAMLMVLVAVLGRPLLGDLRAYAAAFYRIRELPLSAVFDFSEPNALFTLFTWLVGQFFEDGRALLASVALLTVGGVLYGSRMVLSRYETALLFFIYSSYPFFINFISSALKNALALTLMHVGLVLVHRGRGIGWLWLALAPLFHLGTSLVFPFLFLHLFLFRYVGAKREMAILLAVLAAAIALSATAVSEVLLKGYTEGLDLPQRYDIYTLDAEAVDYRSGFRLDFTLFSLVPIASYYYLRGMRYPLTDAVSGWWVALYTSLALIYQLFAFAPFADRFAAFAWFLLPFILVLQAAESRSRAVMAQLVGLFVVVNILSLQFYIGASLLWE